MPIRHAETLRDLLSLLRAPPDDSSTSGGPRGQDGAPGPYRDAHETLASQLKEERERIDREQAVLREQRALLDAIACGAQPRGRSFMRTLTLGAVLGTVSSLTTFLLLLSPHLAHLAPVTLNPPSSWRAHVEAVAPTPTVVVEAPVPRGLAAPLLLDTPPCGDRTARLPITQLTPTVWDVDRRVLRMELAIMNSARVVAVGEGPGMRLYGIRRSSLPGVLGLQNGDAIVAINDRVIDANTTFDARDFDRVTRIEVALVRRGEPLTFTYLLR